MSRKPEGRGSTENGGGQRRGPYARGRERKLELLDAVLRLVAREGVGAVTHRAVADEADTSLRATTYYFATKEEMIREALRHYASLNIARIDVVAERFAEKGGGFAGAVEAIVSVMLEELRDPAALVRAEYELILAISREPSYAPEYEELQRMIEVRLRALLSLLGSDKPLPHARLVLAATRGFQIEQLAHPGSPPSERALRRQIRTLLEALLPAHAS